ncbi:hypothetical protein WEN_00890 [Mycoplasma wenyonii str. Massachusetts]|uniref:Uncharacterized protein n=1 Tax=Mycoplasma wenyonii (strain Massachusetts) TaxID=1197325 RepID=I6YAK4_MYCWM|nr:hypothetical protein [Mycoplasma wenyonii]AFN64981.1 hypothetical protein WEN_00890 [Mycoplasma wenyonii str. Massachusetts]
MVITGLLKQFLIAGTTLGVTGGITGGIVAGTRTSSSSVEQSKSEPAKTTVTKNCKVLLTSQNQTQKIIICPDSGEVKESIDQEIWYLFKENNELQEIDGLSTSNESRKLPEDNSKSHWAQKKWRGYKGAEGIQGTQPNFVGEEDFVFNTSGWSDQFSYYGALQTPYNSKCKGDTGSSICSSIELSKNTLVLYSRSSVNADKTTPICLEQLSDSPEKWKSCDSSLGH